jgi:hypothetical protein
MAKKRTTPRGKGQPPKSASGLVKRRINLSVDPVLHDQVKACTPNVSELTEQLWKMWLKKEN